MLCETGWRLCPAYDLNAEAEPLKPRLLMLSLDGVDDTASLEIALGAAADFGLDAREAAREARSMAEIVRTWRSRAEALRLPRKEIETMAPAFQHADLAKALKLRFR